MFQDKYPRETHVQDKPIIDKAIIDQRNPFFLRETHVQDKYPRETHYESHFESHFDIILLRSVGSFVLMAKRKRFDSPSRFLRELSIANQEQEENQEEEKDTVKDFRY